MMIPTQCHLWQKEHVTSEDLQLGKHFERLITYEDDHLMRHLVKCNDCGQLYFYEFYEWIDWKAGNDPQYRTFLPAAAEEEASELAKKTPTELLGFKPSLRSSFPEDAKEPTVQWLRD